MCAEMIGDEWSDDDATFWKHLGQNQHLMFFTIFTSSCSAPECLLELTIRFLRFDCTFTEVTSKLVRHECSGSCGVAFAPSVPRSRTPRWSFSLIPMKIRKPFRSFCLKDFMHMLVEFIQTVQIHWVIFDAVTVRRSTDGNSSEVFMSNIPKAGSKVRRPSGQDQTYLKTSPKLV